MRVHVQLVSIAYGVLAAQCTVLRDDEPSGKVYL